MVRHGDEKAGMKYAYHSCELRYSRNHNIARRDAHGIHRYRLDVAGHCDCDEASKIK